MVKLIFETTALNDMVEEETNNERIIPNLLKMKHEYLFKTIGKDGKFSLDLKCLFLVLTLIIPCLITISLTDTLPDTLIVYFSRGWGHLVATLFIGIFVWFLIKFIGKIDEKIRHVNQIIAPPKKEKPTQKGYKKWKTWEEKIETYTKCARVRGVASPRWYYSSAILGAFCGFVLSMLQIGPEHGWVLGNFYREWYLRAWYVFLGFFVGACLHYIFGAFWIIRTYCDDVVSEEEILPLDPDRTGGLRELGRLSLDLDLIVALPSVAFPIALLLYKQHEYLGGKITNVEVSIVLSVIYALFLVFVFFVSISPAHDDMVAAKTNYLLKIHSEYKDMHEEFLGKLDTKKRIESKEYDVLSGLYKLYDRVESMAVWPLDFRTTLRFAITSGAPLISVAITISLPF